MPRRSTTLFIILSLLLVILFLLDLLVGSVHIPLRDILGAIFGADIDPATRLIVLDIRLIKAVVAVLAGVALSVSGLQMQTLFRNPLAGPYVLGISSGASLGVAFVVLLSGSIGGIALSRLGFMGEIALTMAAIIGALSIMALIVYVSLKVHGNVTLLIIGVMIGYVANAVIGVLKFFSVEEIQFF